MFTIEATNVADAIEQAADLIGDDDNYRIVTTRNGPAKQLVYPTVISYSSSEERVLLDPVRDANPFFHLFESLWMLGGRNDVEFVKRFNSTIDQFSDDGQTLHGAYGYRWRHHFDTDQLGDVINGIRHDKHSRRQVISMWDPYIDPKVAALGGKDVPCNTHAYVSVKNDMLDLTVCNRSNDMIWGAFGANAVHMSILMEYLACSIGIPMGYYYQFTNDLHLYERHWNLVQTMDWGNPYVNEYYDADWEHIPLFEHGDEDKFDGDVAQFLIDPFYPRKYSTRFMEYTVRPMAQAYFSWKSGANDLAMKMIETVESVDWRIASKQWLERRIEKAKVKIITPPKEIVLDLETFPTTKFPTGGFGV